MENLEKILNQIKNNPRVKQHVAYEHPFWFSLLYLRHHFTYSLAPFHLEMLHLLSKPEHDFIAVMAFRESGKSTIMNLDNVLWSILGKPQKKFVVIVSKTQEQAKNHFLNIKAELENNEALKSDFGPFVENEDDMKRLSLELVYHGSKIMSVHIDQSIRGLKYGSHRPDLIICDDLEDTSISTLKERNLLHDRFNKEIMPLGSGETRVIVLGNLLSEDSFMIRLKEDIGKEKLIGVFRVYPLLDDFYNNLWKAKFKDLDSINKLKAKLSSEAWAKEYLLRFSESKHFDVNETIELKENETNDKMVCDWFHLALAKLEHKYKKQLTNTETQIPLIPHMKQYIISAPDRETFIDPEKGNPLYEVHQEYLREQTKITEEFHAAFKRAIRWRSYYREIKEDPNSDIKPPSFHKERPDPNNMEIWDDDMDYWKEDQTSQKQSTQPIKNSIEEKLKEFPKHLLNKIRKLGYYDPILEIDIPAEPTI